MPLLRSYERKTVTATSDAPFQLCFKDSWYNFADIFVFDNSAYVGDVSGQDILINVGDIYTILTPVNIHDFFFKNVTPGSNARVLIAGTPMTKAQAALAGIVLE